MNREDYGKMWMYLHEEWLKAKEIKLSVEPNTEEYGFYLGKEHTADQLMKELIMQEAVEIDGMTREEAEEMVRKNH